MIILKNPILTKDCKFKNYEDHYWKNEEKSETSLKEKNVRKSVMEKNDVKPVYFKSKLKENHNQDNSDL